MRVSAVLEQFGVLPTKAAYVAAQVDAVNRSGIAEFFHGLENQEVLTKFVEDFFPYGYQMVFWLHTAAVNDAGTLFVSATQKDLDVARRNFKCLVDYTRHYNNLEGIYRSIGMLYAKHYNFLAFDTLSFLLSSDIFPYFKRVVSVLEELSRRQLLSLEKLLSSTDDLSFGKFLNEHPGVLSLLEEFLDKKEKSNKSSDETASSICTASFFSASSSGYKDAGTILSAENPADGLSL